MLAVIFAVSYVLNKPSIYVPTFIILGFTYGVTAVVEAITVGLDTMRGRFILLLSTIGFFISLALITSGIVSEIFHILFRVSIFVAVAFMFLNLRYKLGITLNQQKKLIAIVLGIVILIITFIVSGLLHAPLYREIILWIDAASLFLVVLNVLMYMGGDIEKIWIAGLIAMVVLLLGDVFFLLNFPRNVHLVFWFIPLFIMNNVALKVIEEG